MYLIILNIRTLQSYSISSLPEFKLEERKLTKKDDNKQTKFDDNEIILKIENLFKESLVEKVFLKNQMKL